MAAIVDNWRSMGIEVPDCWWFHEHLARRLAAVIGWYIEAHDTKTGTARAAAEWWASTWGLAGLQDEWAKIGGHSVHNGVHVDEAGTEKPMPPFNEFVAGLAP
jgi:hypothetical protein